MGTGGGELRAPFFFLLVLLLRLFADGIREPLLLLLLLCIGWSKSTEQTSQESIHTI